MEKERASSLRALSLLRGGQEARFHWRLFESNGRDTGPEGLPNGFVGLASSPGHE
jgi:hypothetical protein